MSGYIGECFEGSVSSVASFGMFVRLDNTIEGLVPIGELPGEYFFDEKNMSLVSRGGVFRLGDRVRVCVDECDTVRGNISFTPADDKK